MNAPFGPRKKVKGKSKKSCVAFFLFPFSFVSLGTNLRNWRRASQSGRLTRAGEGRGDFADCADFAGGPIKCDQRNADDY
jgi:hypothetical protein